MDFDEINTWLASYYPELELRRMYGGAYGVHQRVKRWTVYDMTPTPECYYQLPNGKVIDGIAFPEVGYSCLFDTRRQMLGWWVCEEVMRRDPRLAYREGNYFHQAFLQSYYAEQERERSAATARESGLRSWEIVKRNEKLMGRISDHMTRGRMDLAVQELSPEQLLRSARREKPSEIRSKDFWRSIARG